MSLKEYTQDVQDTQDEQYTLGTFYGKETVNIEFKEFCLRLSPRVIMNTNDILDTIHTGKWSDKITYLIENNLKNYFDYMFPKYLASYWNSNINGNFIIGVNDYGEITGIPFLNTMDELSVKKMVQTYINDSIKNHIKTKVPIDTITSIISIKVHKLKINIHLIEDEMKELFDTYQKKFIQFNNDMDQYVLDKCIWLGKMKQYSGKLFNSVNTTKIRNELIHYIEEHQVENEYIDLIELLKSDTIIKIPSGITISILKKKGDNIIYWLTTYKDFMLKKITKERPKKPNPNHLINLVNLFSRLSVMRYRFLKNNDDIIYYMIEINFQNINNDEAVLFKFPNSKKWNFKTRITLNGDPCCI